MKRADTDDQETVVLSTSETIATPARAQPTATTATEGPRGMGLGTKFFLAAAVLVILTLGTALAVTTHRAHQVAERTIRAALDQVPDRFRAYRADLMEQLRARVRTLADDAGTKSVFGAGVDVATRFEFAREYRTVLDAATVFMFDADAWVIARSDKPDGEGLDRNFRRVGWVADPLFNRRDATAAIVDKGMLALVASVSVISGAGEQSHLDGALAAAYPLAGDAIDALRGITRGEVAFVTNNGRSGEPEADISAASAGFRGAQFLELVRERDDFMTELLDSGKKIGPIDLSIDGESLLMVAVPITSASGVPLGAFVVTRSRSEEMAAFQEIQHTLLIVAIAAVVLSFPLSFAMGRRIARPLRLLTKVAVDIRDGRLDADLPAERRDEVGALARAFGAMMNELKEKRALQQMLVDMRRRAPEAMSPDMTLPSAVPIGETTSQFEIGARVGGRYDVLRSLGRGGMGVVFQANDIELDDIVALKVLSPEAFKDGTEALETLKREIRLARKITHPNVVRVHDFAEANGVRFVTMEFVPGMTLRALTKRPEPIALGPGLQIVKQIVRGLAAIHQAGILHRDMKPENVMVLPDGMVKLMDFGIAEQTDKVAESEFVVGTPRYMSPEQLRGRKVDGRSDLYAVGVLMYEVFTGIQPFRGSLTEVVQKHVSSTPTPPIEHRPDLPTRLNALIVQLLAKNADDRPATPAAVYQTLLRIS